MELASSAAKVDIEYSVVQCLH